MSSFKMVMLWLVVVLIATSWSLFHPGLFHVHDTTHAARIAEMTRSWQDGQFPVRWVKNFGVGYGMPLFEFYAPLPYYVGSIFYQSGLSIEWVIKILYVLSTGIIFGGTFLLAKELFRDERAGLLSAVAVTLAPYRAVNLFVRGAISESWGMMVVPWLLWGLLRLKQDKLSGYVITVISGSVLLLSHNLTTFMALPLVSVFLLGMIVLWFKNTLHFSVLKYLFALFKAGILILGLTSFYWLPMLGEQHLTKVSGLSQAFHYSRHFVYTLQLIKPLWGYGGSAPPPYNDQSYFLGYGQLLATGVTFALAGLYIVRYRRLNTQINQLVIISILCACSIFLLHGRSQFIWQAIPVMQILQFPWRWLSLASIWFGLITGGSIVFISPRWANFLFGLLAGIIIVTNTGFFRPEGYLSNADTFYSTDSAKIRQQSGPGMVDYLPLKVTDLQPVSSVVSTNPAQPVMILEELAHKVRVKTMFDATTQLQFNIADFPGWTVRLDEVIVSKEPGINGTFSVIVPPGEHVVTAIWQLSSLRRLADLITIVTIIVISLVILLKLRNSGVKSMVKPI